MKIYVFKITGLTPLLQNDNRELIQKEDEAVKKSKKKYDNKKEAEKRVLKNKDGTFYAKSLWFRTALLRASSYKKIGKYTARQAVAAGIFLVEPTVKLLSAKTGKPFKKYELDIRPVYVGSGVKKSGVPRVRPMFNDWMVRLPLELDEEWMPPEIALELFNIAGRLSGVGDYRPNCNGTFGMFKAELETT